MKDAKFLFGLFIILIILLFNNDIKYVFYLSIQQKQSTQIDETLDYDTSCAEEVIVLPHNFTIVYESFKSYNPYIDSASAISFANVANCYGISDNETLKWSLAQILLESGAKQYYQPTHPKEGELVVSSAGAIGFTQILPSTALGYMIKKVSSDDVECFNELGATDFSFAYKKDCSKSDKIILTKEWLKDENNNIIMWGKIMSLELESKPILDALISYNAGSLGWKRYLNAGNIQEEHDYIKGIRVRFKYIDV